MLKIKATADNVKNKVKEINKDFLTVSNDIVEETIAAGEQWQTVFAKALKTGTGIFNAQQDLALRAVEGIKGQYVEGNKRWRKLLGWKKGTMKKAVKTVEQKAVKAVKETQKAVAAKNEELANKAKKAVTPKKEVLSNKAAKAVAPKTVAPKAAMIEDLKAINGIGPKTEKILAAAGINSFAKLAGMKVDALEAILTKESPRYASLDLSAWILEAKKMVTTK